MLSVRCCARCSKGQREARNTTHTGIRKARVRLPCGCHALLYWLNACASGVDQASSRGKQAAHVACPPPTQRCPHAAVQEGGRSNKQQVPQMAHVALPSATKVPTAVGLRRSHKNMAPPLSPAGNSRKQCGVWGTTEYMAFGPLRCVLHRPHRNMAPPLSPTEHSAECGEQLNTAFCVPLRCVLRRPHRSVAPPVFLAGSGVRGRVD